MIIITLVFVQIFRTGSISWQLGLHRVCMLELKIFLIQLKYKNDMVSNLSIDAISNSGLCLISWIICLLSNVYTNNLIPKKSYMSIISSISKMVYLEKCNVWFNHWNINIWSRLFSFEENSLFPMKRKKEDSIISISINIHFIGHLISFLSTL